MSVEAIAAPAGAARRRLDVGVRGVAWALVASAASLCSATVLVAGERAASYADLRAAVADGRVDEVRVEGGLDRPGRGAPGVDGALARRPDAAG